MRLLFKCVLDYLFFMQAIRVRLLRLFESPPMDNAVTERQRRYTLFMLVLVFTSSHVDRQIMGILGQPIKESLLITDTQLGLLTGIMFAVCDTRHAHGHVGRSQEPSQPHYFFGFLMELMTALCGAAATISNCSSIALAWALARPALTRPLIP